MNVFLESMRKIIKFYYLFNVELIDKLKLKIIFLIHNSLGILKFNNFFHPDTDSECEFKFFKIKKVLFY